MNIIKAVNMLEDVDKPTMVILTPEKSQFDLLREQTNYPYLVYRRFPALKSLPVRGLNKIWKSLFSKPLTDVHSELKIQLDFLYYGYPDSLKTSAPKTHWIPDFQEHFYPSFFTEDQLKIRKEGNAEIAEKSDLIVFSSQNALSHFNEIYPESKAEKYVLRFAVIHPRIDHLNVQALKEKYDLNGDYLFVANQFWAHKNHGLLIEALDILKKQGVNLTVACSGKRLDTRNPEYVKELDKQIQQRNLEGNFKFLGFMDRAEQLLLMKYSKLIVQPSLFEGWSTVVEDAKALGKFILVSDISIHREQIESNCAFFDPKDSNDLAQTLLTYTQNDLPEMRPLNYSDNVKQFGRDFLDMVDKYGVHQ